MVRALFAVALIGCNPILGWDRAELDPILVDTGTRTDATTPSIPSCETYCSLMSANCSGTRLQYLTPDVCLAMCPVFDLGALDDDAKPSLGCRQKHAALAANDPATHCASAGPLGGNLCGDRCKNFCAVEIARCGILAYLEKECSAACPMFAYDPSLSITSDQENDTLNCRSYHLQASYPNDTARATHCVHTAKASDMCTPPGDAGVDAATD
jgi:hypothetical protein